MMHKLVREVARKHGLTHARTFDMLVDFLESLIEQDKIVTQDLIDYFEEEVVELAKSGEEVQQSFGFTSGNHTAVMAKPVVSEPLDADTKVVVKLLLEAGIRVDAPVKIKFVGNKAVVSLVSNNYGKPQVAVVKRVNGKLSYNTVNFDHPHATME